MGRRGIWGQPIKTIEFKVSKYLIYKFIFTLLIEVENIRKIIIKQYRLRINVLCRLNRHNRNKLPLILSSKNMIEDECNFLYLIIINILLNKTKSIF